MRTISKLLFLCLLFTSCGGQTTDTGNNQKNKLVGGGCDGCDLMYDGMPKNILSEHTSIGWTDGKEKLLVSGKVMNTDGKTPAPGIIIYYWHTDETGIYPNGTNIHGKLKGWVKSGEDGSYTIKTSRPGAYPAGDNPRHIHLSIKEPSVNEYYADLYFSDDPLYAPYIKKHGQFNRAGNEVLTTRTEGNILIAEHNIILGMKIPGYPGNQEYN